MKGCLYMWSRNVITVFLALFLALAAPLAAAQDTIVDGEVLRFDPVQLAMRAWYGGSHSAEADSTEWNVFVTVAVLEFRSREGAIGYFDLNASRVEEDTFVSPAGLQLGGERSESFWSPFELDDVTGPGQLLEGMVQEGELFIVATVIVFAVDDTPVDPQLMATQEELVPHLIDAVLTTESGDDTPVEMENGWEGGVWDRFPSREAHPFPDAILHDAADTYQIPEGVEATPEADATATAGFLG